MKVLLDKVLIKPIPEKNKTQLFIPATAKEKPDKGLVLQVGEGRPKEPMLIKEGQTILYSKHAGIEVDIKGEKHLVIKQTDIIMILEDV